MFSQAVFAVLVLIASATAQLECSRTYTVRLGDVCDSISAANNVSTYQLALVNPQINADCSNLALGEPLCLGDVGEDCDETYTIVSGDGCAAIAQSFSIELDVLFANNPNVNAACSNIYPGEVLCVADTDVYA